MNINQETNLKIYIKKIDELLPYSKSIKKEKLKDLENDVRLALEDSDSDDIESIFGNHLEVAKNFSKSQDWNVERASWGIRILAWWVDTMVYFFVDLIILMSFAYVFMSLLLSPDELLEILNKLYNLQSATKYLDQNKPIESILALIILVIMVTVLIAVSFGYFIIQEAKYSKTIGKKLFGLKVVDKSGIKINWSQSILRNITKPGISSTFFIFDILIGRYLEKQDPTKANKQRGLEILAETIVIRMK